MIYTPPYTGFKDVPISISGLIVKYIMLSVSVNCCMSCSQHGSLPKIKNGIALRNKLFFFSLIEFPLSKNLK